MSKFIPGHNSTYSKRPAQFPAAVPPCVVTALGCRVWDETGTAWIDTTAALGAVLLGYRHPALIGPVIAQIKHGGPLFPLPTPLEHEAAATICRLTGWEQVKFCKNGSDATEAAVRLARFLTKTAQSHTILTNSYHGSHSDLLGAQEGRSKGVLAACQYSLYRVAAPTQIFAYFAESAHPPAALLMEPLHPTHTAPWPWAEIKALCEQHGTLLIFDEVLTGFRFGLQGGMGHVGVRPHLACYGKALANGYPLACVAGPRALMQHFEEDVFFSGTYCEETLSLAACCATLGYLAERPDLYPALDAYGDAVRLAFDGLVADAEGRACTQGHSMRFQFVFADPAQRAAFVAGMAERGVLIGKDFFVTEALSQDVPLGFWPETFAAALTGLAASPGGGPGSPPPPGAGGEHE